MVQVFFYNTGWYPGGKRPLMTAANCLVYLLQKQVDTTTQSGMDFAPNVTEDMTYFDMHASDYQSNIDYMRIYASSGATPLGQFCYFVIGAKLITPDTVRLYTKWDAFLSAIINGNPLTITVKQPHIVGAHGGGIPAANAEAPNTAILPVGMMEVTTTQALNLVEVTPLSTVVRLIVAMTFEQGPTDDPRRNFIFIVTGTFTDAAGIVATLVQTYNTNSYAPEESEDVWTDGVVSGAWYAPAGVLSTAGGTNGLIYYEVDGVRLGQDVIAVDPCAFGQYAVAANLLSGNTQNFHCRIGNPLRSVEVCLRPWNTPVIFSYSINGEAGTFSFGFMIDNQFVDLTETVALPYAVVTQNSGKTQREIADTIGMIGSGIGLVTSVAAAVPTGGLSLLGTVPSITSFGQQIAEKISRPTPNSAVPGAGLNSMYAFVVDGEGETKEWTGGLCIMNYQSANMPDFRTFGYPMDYRLPEVTLNPTGGSGAPSPNHGYFIRIDDGEPVSVPPQYRDGFREQLRAGVIVYNGVYPE